MRGIEVARIRKLEGHFSIALASIFADAGMLAEAGAYIDDAHAAFTKSCLAAQATI